MSKRSEDVKPADSGKRLGSRNDAGTAVAAPVTKKDFLALAASLGGRESVQRVLKKDAFTQALSAAGELYESREFVAAYERFQPVYEKVVADLQRVLARNA
jgi:hypothetical protein